MLLFAEQAKGNFTPGTLTSLPAQVFSEVIPIVFIK